MAKSQPPPTSADVLFERILSVTAGPAIGGLGFALGLRSQAEDRNVAAVLSMSGLDGASAMAQLFGEIPSQQQVEKEAGKTGNGRQLWGKWFNVETEKQVVNRTEEDSGAAVLLVRSEALLINMPISIASTFYHHPRLQQQPDMPLGMILDADAPS